MGAIFNCLVSDGEDGGEGRGQEREARVCELVRCALGMKQP